MDWVVGIDSWAPGYLYFKHLNLFSESHTVIVREYHELLAVITCIKMSLISFVIIHILYIVPNWCKVWFLLSVPRNQNLRLYSCYQGFYIWSESSVFATTGRLIELKQTLSKSKISSMAWDKVCTCAPILNLQKRWMRGWDPLPDFLIWNLNFTAAVPFVSIHQLLHTLHLTLILSQ